MGGMTGGGKSGGGGGKGGGGISGADYADIGQALGMDQQMMHATYQQLGLGVPDPSVYGGDPATAAAAGGSLQYGSPGTAEQTDQQGLSNMANAALGQLQLSNQNNPAVPGSAANIAQGNSQLSSLAGQQGFNAGFNSGGSTGAGVGSEAAPA